MIKQIQLRGISRDPSDRSNADGGCAESLNVHLNEGELAPAPIPKDITSTIGVDSTFKVLYIHKVGDKTNYIGLVGTSLYAKMPGDVEAGENPVEIYAFETGESLVGITSVGNILVWTTNNGTRYAIFRATEERPDGTYTYLGDSVPEPTVTFSTTAGTAKEITFEETLINRSYVPVNPLGLAATYWNTIYSHVGLSNTDVDIACNGFYKEFSEKLWSNVAAARVQLRGNGEFSAPVLARYALRMYDGSYIYISAPILLFGSVEHSFFKAVFNFNGETVQIPETLRCKILFDNTFTASVRVDFGEGGLWKDYIESVDIFLSTDIQIPKIDAKLGQAYDYGSKVIDPTYPYANDCSFEFDGVSDYAWLGSDGKNKFKEDFETQMLEKGNFYRVASIPAFTATYLTETLKPKSQDDLVVLPRLSEGEAHQITGLGGVGSYNERLILTGERITLSRGNQRPDAMLPAGAYTGHEYVTAYFYVRTSGGSGTKIVEGYASHDIVNKERARAYIAYPDPKCYQAVYYVPKSGGYYKYTIPMKEHPRLNCAYGFWGLGYRLDERYNSGDTREEVTVDSITEVEDRTYDVYNRLFLSEVDNPFVFPLGQRITFDSDIISAMPITIPLSSGQFGQYQLYVFTKEGIWAEAITDEGKIAANHPVTRDAPYEGAVAQLDQSIVFASPSGVMMMYGAEIKNISPSMVAERDVLGDASATISNLGDWTDLMTIALDNTQFLDYIKEARFAYDYPGKRLLVFRSDKSYAWVYKLDTATWHKQQLPANKSFSNALNSYPSALVTMLSSGAASVVDFTTEFGDNTYPLRTAMVITRNLDLDAPDIRKEIRALKIRGAYRMGGSTKVVVLGSMDGRYFKQLTSLHNGSFKFYKLILLMKLYPDERVSWVDIDYDTRFTNKLR